MSCPSFLPEHLVREILDWACGNIVDWCIQVSVNKTQRDRIYQRDLRGGSSPHREIWPPFTSYLAYRISPCHIPPHLWCEYLADPRYYRYLLEWLELPCPSSWLDHLARESSPVRHNAELWEMLLDRMYLTPYTLYRCVTEANVCNPWLFLFGMKRMGVEDLGLRACWSLMRRCLSMERVCLEREGNDDEMCQMEFETIYTSLVEQESEVVHFQTEGLPPILVTSMRKQADLGFRVIMERLDDEQLHAALIYYISEGLWDSQYVYQIMKRVPITLEMFEALLKRGREAVILQVHYDSPQWLVQLAPDLQGRLLEKALDHICIFRFLLGVLKPPNPQRLLHRALMKESRENIGAILKRFPEVGPDWPKLRYSHVWGCHLIRWFPELSARSPLPVVPAYLWEDWFQGPDASPNLYVGRAVRERMEGLEKLLLVLVSKNRLEEPENPLCVLQHLVYGGYSAKLLERLLWGLDGFAAKMEPYVMQQPLCRTTSTVPSRIMMNHYMVHDEEDHCIALLRVYPEMRLDWRDPLRPFLDFVALALDRGLQRLIRWALEEGRMSLCMKHVRAAYRRALREGDRRVEVWERLETGFEDELLACLEKGGVEWTELQEWCSLETEGERSLRELIGHKIEMCG